MSSTPLKEYWWILIIFAPPIFLLFFWSDDVLNLKAHNGIITRIALIMDIFASLIIGYVLLKKGEKNKHDRLKKESRIILMTSKTIMYYEYSKTPVIHKMPIYESTMILNNVDEYCHKLKNFYQIMDDIVKYSRDIFPPDIIDECRNVMPQIKIFLSIMNNKKDNEDKMLCEENMRKKKDLDCRIKSIYDQFIQYDLTYTEIS